MYEHAARGPFNSFVYPAPFSIPKFETEDKKEWSIGNSGDPFVIEKAPLTCRHKPRITKINGKWKVFDGFGDGNNVDDGATVDNFEQARLYAISCVEHHKMDITRGYCSGQG
jgi:hypothetical protein